MIDGTTYMFEEAPKYDTIPVQSVDKLILKITAGYVSFSFVSSFQICGRLY